MNDRFGMDNHLDHRGRKVEQPAGLDQLQPFLKSVAESMVTLFPMRQVGCASACSGVALAISSLLALRKGPPLAVRMILRISLRRPQWMAWKIAECSESIGRMLTLCLRASGITSEPATTSASLFANASVLPASIAASTAV